VSVVSAATDNLQCAETSSGIKTDIHKLLLKTILDGELMEIALLKVANCKKHIKIRT
jgi:hypothetical protein